MKQTWKVMALPAVVLVVASPMWFNRMTRIHESLSPSCMHTSARHRPHGVQKLTRNIDWRQGRERGRPDSQGARPRPPGCGTLAPNGHAQSAPASGRDASAIFGASCAVNAQRCGFSRSPGVLR